MFGFCFFFLSTIRLCVCVCGGAGLHICMCDCRCVVAVTHKQRSEDSRGCPYSPLSCFETGSLLPFHCPHQANWSISFWGNLSSYSSPLSIGTQDCRCLIHVLSFLDGIWSSRLCDKFVQTAIIPPQGQCFFFFNTSCTSYFLIVLIKHLTETTYKKKGLCYVIVPEGLACHSGNSMVVGFLVWLAHMLAD